MKKFLSMAIIASTLFNSTGVFAATRAGWNINPGSTFWHTPQQQNVISNYFNLPVGYWTSFDGDSMQIVSGGEHVSIQGMIVKGASKGSTVINVYKNGSLYSVQHITVS